VVHDAPPRSPQDSFAVGIVHGGHGAVPFRQIDDGGQGSHVSIHGKDSVGDDELSTGVGGMLPQAGLQIFHVVVAVADDGGPGEAAGVDDGGVVELVAEDQVVLSHHGGNGGHVRREAGRHHDGRLGSLEGRQALFQVFVNSHGARDGAHRPGTHPIAIYGFLDPGAKARIVAKPQVVVGAEV